MNVSVPAEIIAPETFVTIRPVQDPPYNSGYAWLRPRCWPTAVLFVFLWLVTRLPYRWQMALGSIIGRLAITFARQRRRIGATNLQLCFPELDSAQRNILLRDHFDSLGKGIVETALCWWGRTSQLRSLYTLVGRQHLEEATSKGRGVILLSAHLTTLELGGRLLAMEHTFHVLYRQHKNPLFEDIMHKARERRFEKAIPRDNTRELLTSLKSGMPVWYAPDQNHGGSHSVFAPFFGIQASTLATTARLARLSGASVVPFFQQRLPDGQGYLLVLCPALQHFPTGDPIKDATRINQLIESVVREIPEQYLWVHRRFKTRPEGETSPYEL